MIIWGSRAKENVRATGEFYCPRCNETRTYKHKRLQRYFTLYFIPLFATSTIVEWVECLHCGQQFKPDILNEVVPTPEVRLARHIARSLQQGASVEAAVQWLMNAGMDNERALNEAQGIVDHLGGRYTCPGCNVNHLRSIKVCPNCGRAI
jgi:zinc-ribbon family